MAAQKGKARWMGTYEIGIYDRDNTPVNKQWDSAYTLTPVNPSPPGQRRTVTRNQISYQ